MLTTNPEHNRPIRSTCAKCGKSFVHSPWTNGYSTNFSYKFADPQEFGLVTLCDDCAKEELALGHVSHSGRVSRIMF